MFSASKRTVRSIVITVVTVVFLVFAANNHDAITVGLFPLPYTMTLPKFLFAIVCFTLGVVVGSFMINLKLNQTHRKYKSEHRRVVALQNEISAMNRQPQKLVAASSKG